MKVQILVLVINAIFAGSFAFAQQSFRDSSVSMSVGSQSLNQAEYSEQTTFIQAALVGTYPISTKLNANYNFKTKINSTSKNFNENAERTKNSNNSTEFKIVDTEFAYSAPNFEVSGFIINQHKTQFFSKLADRGPLGLLKNPTQKLADKYFGEIILNL